MKQYTRTLWLTLTLFGLALPGAALAGKSDRNPVEVGPVDWGRDYDRALADSRRSGKPVFAFFQEVPGCAGCKQFGSEVMSHPLIVAAVENAFVPLLIYNNRPGRDAELLRSYNEPSWNYQVVRFLNAEGADLIPRKDKVWTVDALVPRMIASLEAAGREVPAYLRAARSDRGKDVATAAFSQHCFWTGEFKFGRIPGVLTTEAGWFDGREVTRVRYQPEVLPLGELLKAAVKLDAADGVYLEDAADRGEAGALNLLPVGALDDSYRTARDSDQKKQIERRAFSRMALTPIQRTKVNAFAPVDIGQALSWLTPEQQREYRELSRR